MNLEMWFVLAIIVIPLALVITNRWRADVAALTMIVALGGAQYFGFKVLTNDASAQAPLLAISGFSQPVVITLIGLFILTQTLSQNGIMTWLGQRLSAIGRNSETRLVLLFSCAAALLSLIMNNAVVGTLLLPTAMQASRRAVLKPSKLLIPIAFGSALGGMATYFTTANIVLSNLLLAARPPQQTLGVLSFVPTGGLIAIIGLLYLGYLGYRLIPPRSPAAEQEMARRPSNELENLYSLGEHRGEAAIGQDSTLNGKTLEQARIGETFGLAVVAIWRGSQALFTPDANEKVRSGDLLLLVGREERVQKLMDLGVQVNRQIHMISNFGVTLIELILAPHSAYAGKTLKELNFRRTHGFTTIAILRRGRSYRTDVGQMQLEFGDSLLMIGAPDRVRDLRVNPEIIIFEPLPVFRAVPRRRATLSVLVFLFGIAISIAGVPVYLSVLAASLIAIALGLFPVQQIYRAVEWPVIVFMAGMYAASLAMVATGLAHWIGSHVIDMVGGAEPVRLAAVAFLLAAALTQFMGSQATAFVIGPIAISAAIHYPTNPQAIAVACAIGCSASFLTPLAHPVNMIMMGPGNYRFGDFTRVGAGLIVIVFIGLMVAMKLFWKL